MSFRINHSDLSDEQKSIIKNSLVLQKPFTKFSGQVQSLGCYSIEETILLVPFAFAKQNLLNLIQSQLNIQFTKNSQLKFNGELNQFQLSIKKELFDYLNKNQCVILSLACGMGKTALALYICCKLKFKTLVICHRIVLINQWKESISKFCTNAKIQVLTSSNKQDLDADFYLINLTNLPKRDQIKNVGILVCDEAHVIATERLVKGLFKITPKYCIALTATPERPDQMDKVLYLIFGQNILIRKNTKSFIVYNLQTDFEIITKQTKSEGLDWNSVVESQSLNLERNSLISHIAKLFIDDNIMIACKRVEQCNILKKQLDDLQQSSCVFTGQDKFFDKNARILVTTFSKGAVGLDHPKLNLLIIASDCKDGIEQLIGRVFRRPDVDSKIIDIVDNFGILQKHWKDRKNLYLSLNGVIKSFKNEFPSYTGH